MSLTEIKSSSNEAGIGVVFDSNVQDAGKASAPGDDYQSAPGILPGAPEGSGQRAAGLSLMRTVSAAEEKELLLMLKMAEFEHGEESGKKLAKLKKEWIQQFTDDQELGELDKKERKKLALLLYDDFISFVFSGENLHKNTDDLRAILRKLSKIEGSREAYFGINDLPSGYIGRVFSPKSIVFGLMSDVIELYNDDSFRNRMKRIVDDAFSADVSAPDNGTDHSGDEAPAGSLLSKHDIV